MKIKVTVLPYYGPRPSERTFPPKVGSIGHIGRKKVTLRRLGFKGCSSFSKAA